MITAAPLPIAETRKQPECPSTHDCAKKERVVPTHNGTPFSLKEEGSLALRDMAEPGGHQ